MPPRNPRTEPRGKIGHPFKSKGQRDKAKLLKRLRRLEKGTLAWRQFQKQDYGTIRSANSVINGYPYHMTKLISPSNWEPCFQSEGLEAGEEPRKFDIRTVRVRWLLQPETSSLTACNAQVYIVSVKNHVAQQFAQETDDGLELTVNEHYIHNPLDSAAGQTEGFGLYFLNKAYFRIHYHKLVRFGAENTGGTAVTNIRDYTKMGSTRIKWNKQIKTVKNVGFTEIPDNEVQDTTRLYCYVFTNAETDQAFWSMNCFITGQCVAGT